jgi:hypothetical protein
VPVEGPQHPLLAGGGRGALGDLTGIGGQGDQVHPVELAAGVAPGVGGGVPSAPERSTAHLLTCDFAAALSPTKAVA